MPDTQAMHFGQALAEARAAKELTQQQLGDAMKVTQQGVARWESSALPIRPEKISRLEAILGPFWFGRRAEIAPVTLHARDTTRRYEVTKLRTSSDFERTVAGMLPDLQGNFSSRIEYFPSMDVPVDYASDKLVLEIATVTPHAHQHTITWSLWRLSSCRAAMRDDRVYCQIVYLPAGPLPSRAFARLSVEANLHGIELIAVTTPEQAAEVIRGAETGTFPGHDDEGDQQFADMS